MADSQDIEAAKPGITYDESEMPAALAEKRRIKYVDDDEIQAAGYPSLHRTKSAYSVRSIGSVNSNISGRRRSVDPASLLPIQYRTLSYNIEDSKTNPIEKQIENKKKKQKKQDVVSDELENTDWHTLSEEDVCNKLSTDPSTGLPDEQVKAAVAQYGKNMHSPPPSRLPQKIFWYLFAGFGSILFGGGILVMISWKPLGEPDPALANLALGIVLFCVWIIQAAFNAWQDFSSGRVMKSITGMLPEDCHVIRKGQTITISAVDIVPGDVLIWKAGSKLPADIRFTQVSTDAKFDRSILTGETAPLSAVLDFTDKNYLETRNIGFAGTHCTSGSGLGVVVSTGDNTVFGHIAKLASNDNGQKSPLQKEIMKFVFFIVSLMIFMNIVVLAVWGGYIRKYHPGYMPPAVLVVDLVSVAIAFVPEGLPIALTASLTITANTMKKNNILCKSLKTVETLGAVGVLLSDKTGTLTKNLMVVTDILVGITQLTIDEASKAYFGEKSNKGAIDQLRVLAAVNNAGEFDPTTNHLPLAQRSIIADATDAAILRFSETLAPITEARALWRKRFDLAFNSKNKFALRVLSVNDAAAVRTTLSVAESENFDRITDYLLAIKGAPDVLIPRCTSIVGEDGEVHELSESTRTAIELVKDQWSAQGKRVLLLARKVLHKTSMTYDVTDGEFENEAMRHASSGLTLVGLTGIVDPPREEVPGVVETLHNAGVRVMMVTGDFKLTAQAIARQCGIITIPDSRVHAAADLPRTLDSSKESLESNPSREAIVLSGPELIHLNETQWSVLTTYQSIVFARTTPDQKLRIVKEFKAHGHVVAMTGDGVNDAPSLKEADIGIAPGNASDIALEAADMVLLDSFAAIVEAVKYGRSVFDNLRKTVAYLLPAGSFAEFWPVMTSVLFGLPQVLSSFLMIIICCFTDCFGAIAIAFEKPEADVLERPPRNIRKDHLVDWKLILQSYGFCGIIETLCSFAMSYWYLERSGVPFSKLWFSYGNYDIPGLTADQVQARLNVASSIYFVNLVVMQWFNLMALRTRRLSIVSHPPLFNKATQNIYLFPAILFALVIIFIFSYIPSIQNVIYSADVPVAHWFLPMAFGLGLLLLDETRKWSVRRWPKSLLAKTAW